MSAIITRSPIVRFLIHLQKRISTSHKIPAIIMSSPTEKGARLVTLPYVFTQIGKMYMVYASENFGIIHERRLSITVIANSIRKRDLLKRTPSFEPLDVFTYVFLYGICIFCLLTTYILYSLLDSNA